MLKGEFSISWHAPSWLCRRLRIAALFPDGPRLIDKFDPDCYSPCAPIGHLIYIKAARIMRGPNG